MDGFFVEWLLANGFSHDFQNFFPIVHPLVMVNIQVMPSSEKKWRTPAAIKVLDVIINHIICADNTFVTAKNNIPPRDKRKMFA